ncbi:MAG: helix-turn-helix domain-containing protein [Dethiobacteria bacterium]|nr:helix-turn-helix domain-containing protein [Bacillota bacterium]HQA59590.1 helix-turn-helix domain-containing protein [Tepidanaerobacteraceae bacterium]
MNQYVTGAIIKRLREERKMTQAELAQVLNVSDKAVSKWETGKGYPDITLVEPIAKALGISTIELLAGESISNRNRSFNMLRSKFYVCPVCGNVMAATGESVISCCGVKLPPLEAEEPDEGHQLEIETVEDEYYVSLNHEMTKEHYISFIAGVSDIGIQLVKLYPEGGAEARLKINRTRVFYYYCNHHGLFKITRR